MGAFNYERSMEIIDELIILLEPLQHKAERFRRFYLENLWFKQNIEAQKITLPLDTIHGYFLGYVILEDVFSDYREIKGLAEELAQNIQKERRYKFKKY